MTKLYTTGLALVLLISLLRVADARAQTSAWQAVTGHGYGEGGSVRVDAAGNEYLSGTSYDTLTFGALRAPALTNNYGTLDVFVAKRSCCTGWQWAARATGSRFAGTSGLAIDGSGNVYVSGFFADTLTFGTTTLICPRTEPVPFVTSQPFVAKLSPTGEWLWALKLDGAYGATKTGLAVDGRGNVYVSGTFGGRVSFGATTFTTGPGDADVFVAQLSPAGAWQWAVRAGGYNIEYAGQGLAVDARGDVYLTGRYDSQRATFGAFTLRRRGQSDVFVAKLSAAGTWLWAASAGGGVSDGGTDLALAPDGSVYVTGCFQSQWAAFGDTTLTSLSGNVNLQNAFVGKLTPAGIWAWVATLGAAGSYTDGVALAVDAAGDAYVTGTFADSLVAGTIHLRTDSSNAHWTADAYVAKISAGGAWQWALSAGSAIDDYGRGLAVAASGEVLLTGEVRGIAATFGPLPLTRTQPTDNAVGFFLARIGFPPPPAHSLFPNPAHETAQLTGIGESAVTIYDALGRAVRGATPCDGTAVLDVRGLAAGVYVVRAGAVVRRLVVE